MKTKPRFSAQEMCASRQLSRDIRIASRRIAPGDAATQDDLKQHAAVIVLEIPGRHTYAWWRSRVNWRMRDWIRKERRALNHGNLDQDGNRPEDDPKASHVEQLFHA
ncbi:MAG: hypothetical protein KIS92_00955 [Planctomycetota bacterium]|nr:hypothetical protein [Planctomycetota bacterium]